jgi:7,8-dihydroneopterin aldolase/epimerase/oxygenase
MDTIFINDLTVNVITGCNSWERTVTQPVILNLAIHTDFLKASQQDDLNLTIDCDLIVNSVIKFCNNTNFKLLESLVIAIEQLLINKYPNNILGLEISAKKLFAITNTKEMGVKIARSYSNKSKI